MAFRSSNNKKKTECENAKLNLYDLRTYFPNQND